MLGRDETMAALVRKLTQLADLHDHAQGDERDGYARQLEVLRTAIRTLANARYEARQT